MSEEVTADKAMARADAAHEKIEMHEDLCAERYRNINTTLADLKKIVAWGGSGVFSLLVIVLGWLMVRAIDSNDSQVQQLQQQMIQMQHSAKAPVHLT